MAWTLTAAVTYMNGNYIKVKISGVSDGNAMAATDLLALDPGGTGSIVKSTAKTGRTLRHYMEGVTLMLIKADPGSGATQPDNAWDFTISDDESSAVYTSTGNSETAISWHDLSTDIAAYPPIFRRLYLTFQTAGDWTANDTIDLYLIGWREHGYRNWS